MPASMARLGFVAIVLLIVGMALGFGAAYEATQLNHKWGKTKRLNGSPPLRPVFLRDNLVCPKPHDADIRVDNAMFEAAVAAELVNPHGESPVHRYAVSYFAWHWRISGGDRCPPSDSITLQLAPLLDRIGWPKANTELNDLRLVERLPPSEVRAKGLAHIGFLDWIPPSDLKDEDSRPYARQLLAEQGKFALPWAKKAIGEMDGNTRLGTSAAYLAVATAPSIALPKLRQLMTDKLASSRKNRTQAYTTGKEVPAIGPDNANRLIELGYALALAGPRAEPYSDPVIDVLNEEIARPAPPFGLMATEPTEFCRIALHIGGRAAQAANGKPFCSPNFKGGDGAPRQF